MQLPSALLPQALGKPALRILLAGAVAAVQGCGKPQAWGEENSLILIAADSLWERVADTTYAVLEPTIYTTRHEKKFVVTQVDPEDERISELRVFRHVLVLGTPANPYVVEAAEESGQAGTLRVPSVFQAADVWARGQTVTAAVLDPERPAGSWREQLPAVLAMVESSFRDRVRNKMFVTGSDTALSRDLAERFGFSISVPRVYDHAVRGDSIVILRNDNPDPSQLIRSVLISWRPGTDSLTAETAYRWRAAIDSVEYNVPQAIDTTRAREERIARRDLDGHPVLEVTGAWRDEGGAVPAGGPFITWLVQCSDRTFFLDAWLYAPGKPKYEYMLQLREILGSFRCAGDSPAEA